MWAPWRIIPWIAARRRGPVTEWDPHVIAAWPGAPTNPGLVTLGQG